MSKTTYPQKYLDYIAQHQREQLSKDALLSPEEASHKHYEVLTDVALYVGTEDAQRAVAFARCEAFVQRGVRPEAKTSPRKRGGRMVLTAQLLGTRWPDDFHPEVESLFRGYLRANWLHIEERLVTEPVHRVAGSYVEGECALQVAIENGMFRAVRVLLQEGADWRRVPTQSYLDICPVSALATGDICAFIALAPFKPAEEAELQACARQVMMAAQIAASHVSVTSHPAGTAQRRRAAV